MPLENVRRTIHPSSLPGTVLGGVKTGALKGIRVTHQAVAKVPAALGGIGSTIARFFARKETTFKPASESLPFKDVALSTKPNDVISPKPLSEYRHPGDWLSSTKKYAEPSEQEQLASVYAGVRSLADDLSDSEINKLMRGTNTMSRVATNMGKPMVEHLRGIVVDAYEDSDVLALRDASYLGRNGYPEGLREDGKDSKAARDAALTADSLLRQIYGTGDHTSDDAARMVPQNLCNALAIALRAIDDGDADDKQMEKAKAKVKADFLALRAINPGIITPQPDENLSAIAQRNIVEFSKLSQNIANGVSIGKGAKEELHDEALRAFEQLGTVDTLAAAFDRFCQAVVDRADDDVVATAIGRGGEMIEEFEEYKLREEIQIRG
jgi:hypothetical protein